MKNNRKNRALIRIRYKNRIPALTKKELRLCVRVYFRNVPKKLKIEWFTFTPTPFQEFPTPGGRG
jgi:hypothetical protein